MERGALIGRYRIEGEIARGGMGAVYRARSPQGHEVALKLLLAGRSATPLERARVAREIQSLLRLRHPNVVQLLDAGEQDGVPYLAMEWIRGETLSARLQREGPLHWTAAVELTQRLARALDYCHEQQVLHRDLKPANVMLKDDEGLSGWPLLTDFGLSKDLASESSSGSSVIHRGSSSTTLHRSMKGRWLGTPGYWPPEQSRGQLDAIGPRSDVYGLGALLYATLTGRPPQEGDTLAEMLEAVDRLPAPPSEHRPGIPPWLDEVCLRALSPEPARRQGSPGEVARELEEGLAGRLRGRSGRVLSLPSGPAPAGGPWLALAALTLLLVILLLLGQQLLPR